MPFFAFGNQMNDADLNDEGGSPRVSKSREFENRYKLSPLFQKRSVDSKRETVNCLAGGGD